MLGTTLKFGYKPIKKLNFQDGITLALFFSFIIGLSIGIYFVSAGDNTIYQFAESIFDSFLENKNSGSFVGVFLKSFIFSLPFLISSFIFGTSILGNIILPVVNLIFGIYYGLIISFVYNTFAISGIAFNFLIIAPAAVLFGALLIFSTKESICFSTMLLKNSLPKGTSYNFSKDLKLYSLRFLIFLILFIVVALIDAILTSVFIKFFNF